MHAVMTNRLCFFVAATKIVSPEVGTGLYQYFVKVIPTIYTDEAATQLYTNQFTVTERFRPFALPTGEGGAFVPNQVNFSG
jgi:Endoplasmic reticulum vesicle transporter